MNIIKTIIISMVVALNTTNVFAACSKPQLEVQQAFNTADAVFHGQVTNIQYLDNPETSKLEARMIVTFEVIKSWKGPQQAEMKLYTTHNRTSCNGYVFKAGEQYLVYSVINGKKKTSVGSLVSSDKVRFGVKVYGGTKSYLDAEQDIRFLDKK